MCWMFTYACATVVGISIGQMLTMSIRQNEVRRMDIHRLLEEHGSRLDHLENLIKAKA